ncbi:hypothetical protein J6590_018625 [Homalodisca vitripennis]|nr:hypothetical protein J6590_018625 [Homalodisca vitripennis]
MTVTPTRGTIVMRGEPHSLYNYLPSVACTTSLHVRITFTISHQQCLLRATAIIVVTHRNVQREKIAD